MTSEPLFRMQLVFGYLACLLCFGTYFWTRLKVMDRADAHRVIATLHSFRFFGPVYSSGHRRYPVCPPALAHSPATGTMQPECWPSWRSSQPGYVRSFGLPSSPSISWEQLPSSSTTTTPFTLACLRCRGNWTQPMLFPSFTCPC